MTDPTEKKDKSAAEYAEKPRTRMRRADREIHDEAWVKALLRRGGAGTVGTVLGEQPFLTTVLFAYDEGEGAVYFHTAKVGRMRANVETNPRACFTVFEMGRLLPHEQAIDFSVEYDSVVVFGEVSVITGDEEARRALQMIMEKYAPHLRPGEDYQPIQPEEVKRTTVYRLDIEAWSGKQKVEAEDFPGAYDYIPPSEAER